VLGLVGGLWSEAVVWSAGCVVAQPFGRYASCVVVVPDQDLVEQFSADLDAFGVEDRG